MVYYDTAVVQVDLKDKWRNMMKPKVTIKKKPYEGIGERRPTIRWTTKELEALLAGVDKCAQHTFYPACDLSTAFMQVTRLLACVSCIRGKAPCGAWRTLCGSSIAG